MAGWTCSSKGRERVDVALATKAAADRVILFLFRLRVHLELNNLVNQLQVTLHGDQRERACSTHMARGEELLEQVKL